MSIEGVALWLWLNKRVVLATIASFIVIAVPLMQLSSPLLIEIKKIEVNEKLIEINNNDLRESEKLQDKYSKVNWPINLTKNTEYFRNAISNQKKLLIESSEKKSNYENILIIMLQSIALIIILLSQIQALKILSFRSIEKSETTDFSDFEITEIAENRAEILLLNIEKYIIDNDINQSELADQLDVKSSDFSKLKNKVKRLNGEFLSAKKITELESKFQILKINRAQIGNLSFFFKLNFFLMKPALRNQEPRVRRVLRSFLNCVTELLFQ